MKHLILTLSLTLGLIVVGASPSIHAQESGNQQNAVEPISEQAADSKNTVKIGNGNLNIDLDFGNDESSQKKLNKVAKLVGKVLSEDVGNELSVEFKTLNENEKEELVEVIESSFSFDNDSSNDIPGGAVLLALPAIILFFGTPVFLLLILLHSGYKKRRQKMELVTMYLEADRDLPAHVLNAFDNGGAASSLRSGIVLAAVGLGIVVAFNVGGDDDVAAFGFIPLFIGIGRLVFWYLEERHQNDANQQKLDK